MRKNWINWKRNTRCSVCEIVCPAAVMLLMVILRNVIDVETYDFDTLTKYKAQLSIGLNWDSSAT